MNRLSLAINAIDPRNSQNAGFDGNFNLVSDMKSFVIVRIDGDPFDFLAGPPRRHH